MLHAKEARAIYQKTDKYFQEELGKVEREIRSAAMEGRSFTHVIFSASMEDATAKKIVDELVINGYNVNLKENIVTW